jgi:hypothetical protein
LNSSRVPQSKAKHTINYKDRLNGFKTVNLCAITVRYQTGTGEEFHLLLEMDKTATKLAFSQYEFQHQSDLLLATIYTTRFKVRINAAVLKRFPTTWLHECLCLLQQGCGIGTDAFLFSVRPRAESELKQHHCIESVVTCWQVGPIAHLRGSNDCGTLEE